MLCFSFNLFQPTNALPIIFSSPLDTLSTICHSCLSLGKLQLFYVLDLPPHRSIPASLSFPIRLPSALLSLLSFLFTSPLLSVLRPRYVWVCVYSMQWRIYKGKGVGKVVVCTQLYLFTAPPFPLSLRDQSVFRLLLLFTHTLSPSLLSSKAPEPEGRRERVIWLVYISTGLLFSSLPSHLASPSAALTRHLSTVWTEVQFIILPHTPRQDFCLLCNRACVCTCHFLHMS